MPRPSSTTEFLELLRLSGLVAMAQVDTVLSKQQQVATLPATPMDLARLLVEQGLITEFHAEQLLAGRHRGFILGRYRILRLLGAGGMGRVYLAEHTTMNHKVAIKVLPTNNDPNSSALARFEREARAIAALKHPNIVSAYDIATEGDLHYLVMEFVEGISLFAYVMKKGPVPWRLAADMMCQVADGLHHGHQAGLIHRDIKPSNLLLQNDGTVKILDYGLATFFEEGELGNQRSGNEPITRRFEETVLGTADYIAPEQAIDSHTVDLRADIYSLGCTFYFMLSGQAPFPEGSLTQKLLWHQTRYPKPIEELVRDIPKKMAAIVRKMLAKEPESRFQSCAQLIKVLEPFAQPNTGNLDVTPVDLEERSGAMVDTPHGRHSPTVVGPNSPRPKKTPATPKPAAPPKKGKKRPPGRAGEPPSGPLSMIGIPPEEEKEWAKDFPLVTNLIGFFQKKRNRRLLWIGGGALGIIGLCIGLMVLAANSTKVEANIAKHNETQTREPSAILQFTVAPEVESDDVAILPTVAAAIDSVTQKGSSIFVGLPADTVVGQTLFDKAALNGLKLSGTGSQVLILRDPAATGGVWKFSGVRDVVLSDLTLDGTEGELPLVIVEDATVTFENVTFRNYQQVAVVLAGSDPNVTFKNCTFIGGVAGVLVEGSVQAGSIVASNVVSPATFLIKRSTSVVTASYAPLLMKEVVQDGPLAPETAPGTSETKAADGSKESGPPGEPSNQPAPNSPPADGALQPAASPANPTPEATDPVAGPQAPSGSA